LQAGGDGARRLLVGELAHAFGLRIEGRGPTELIGEELRRLLQAQHKTLVLRVPVFLAFGIWFYFLFYEELGACLATTMAIIALGLFAISRTRESVMLAALFLSEFVLAKLRTEMVPTPLLRATAIAAITALSDNKP
jgi:hypothetical protein